MAAKKALKKAPKNVKAPESAKTPKAATSVKAPRSVKVRKTAKAATKAKAGPASTRGEGGSAEEAAPIAATIGKKKWNLRLYVAGDSPRSRSALANLQKLCEARLMDNYAIEVIDLTKRPDLAKADQILAVPTLIRSIPEPMKRIIGDLSNSDRALVALDLEADAAIRDGA
jgi:circadian clock protein KaiB